MSVKIKIIILLISFMFIVRQNVYSADYYPELGTDPFYSSLNPSYLNEEPENSVSVIELIKKKKNNKTKKIKVPKSAENKDNLQQPDENNYNEEEKKVEEDSNINEEKNKKYIKPEEIDFDIKSLNEVPKSEQKKTDNTSGKKVTSEPAASMEAEKKVLPGILPENNSKQKKERFVTSKYKDNNALAKQLDRDEKEKERMEEKIRNGEPLTFSIKNYWPFKRKAKAAAKEEAVPENPDIELSADYMEYFPDRFEVEAVGNAKVAFIKHNTILSADKIVFNYDRNILRAHQNVVLQSNESRTEGDFIKLDLNKPEGWMEAPVTKTDAIKLSAKEAFIYSDKIEEYDGVAKILQNETLRFGARSFASYVDHRILIRRLKQRKAEYIL